MKELNVEEIKEDMQKFWQAREDFYKYLDESIPKDSMGVFEFGNDVTLSAKEVYKHFFKIDYQARKLRGYLVQTYELKAE
jgi:hypothetical protein